MLHPKKVGTLPIGNGSDEVKQTNEIKYAPILLDNISIENKDITADTLHTQTEFATYLAEQRKADYEDVISIAHGRIEIRRIWATTELNDYVKFPHVAQAYKIEREITDKKKW